MKTPVPTLSPAPSPLPDSLLRQFIGYNMKRAYLVVQSDMNRVLSELGMRQATFAPLAIIIENPDITQTQLGQALSIERSGVVLIVDEMEEAELISRNRVKSDRRSYALRATLKGRQLWEKACVRVQQHEDAIMQDLPDDARSALKTFLNTIEATGRTNMKR